MAAARQVEHVDVTAGLAEAHARRDARRRPVLAKLVAAPELTHAYAVDPDADPDHAIVTIAIRDVATAELSIPRERYDEARMLELLTELHGPPVDEPVSNTGFDIGRAA